MSIKLPTNRFNATSLRGPATVTPKTDAKVSKARAAEAPIASAAAVFARPMSPQEFIQKLEAAKKNILDAPDFGIAFQEVIRQDPLLRAAFDSYVAAIMAGSTAATDAKKAGADAAQRRFQVAEFVEFFKEKLEALKAERDSTPVDLGVLGLHTIQRNKEIQQATATPGAALGGALLAVAELKHLPTEARKDYYLRLAQAAVQDLSTPEGQTPDARTRTHGHLTKALSGLVSLGASKAELLPYLKEAHRNAELIDQKTPGSAASRLQLDGVFLASTHETDRKSAEGRIRVEMEKLKSASESRAQSGNLTPGLLGNFKAILELSAGSRALFAEMSDFIELVTRPAFDAGGNAYRASQDEVNTQRALTSRYTDLIKAVFPRLESAEDRAAHTDAFQKGYGLVLGLLGAPEFPNALLAQIREMTRHADHVGEALQLLESLPADGHQATRQLNGLSAIVTGCLEAKNPAAAFEAFQTLGGKPADSSSHVRNAQIHAAAAVAFAKLTSEEKAKLEPPVLEWLSGAHLRGLEVAFPAEHGKVVMSEALKILRLLGTDQLPLDAQAAEDLVGKVEKMVGDGSLPVYMAVAPALLGILARFPDDISLMERGKRIIDRFVQLRGANSTLNQSFVSPWTNGQTMATGQHVTELGLELLGHVSRLELLSGHAHRIAQCLLLHDQGAAPKLADAIPGLGPYAMKEQLAEQLGASKDLAKIPTFALPLATAPETTPLARKLISTYVEAQLGKAVADIGVAEQYGLIRIEAAMDAATPNLRTSQAMLGLAQAVKKQEKPFELLQLMRANMPEQLIKDVVKQVDDVAIRDFLAGRPRRERGVNAATPDAAEVIPVANVDAPANRVRE